MTSHDAWTSGTYRVLTVASLQRLKVEALIPDPADCEVWSVIKFLNNKRCVMLIAAVVLLQENVRSHTALQWTHLLQEFSWRCLTLNPYLHENLLHYYIGVLVYPSKKGHIIEDMEQKNIYLLYHYIPRNSVNWCWQFFTHFEQFRHTLFWCSAQMNFCTRYI